MNNYDRAREMVDEYVKVNGTDTEMDRNEFICWVHEKYENISVQKNNMYPTDISYNLYNAGLKDFPGPNLCLVYIEERDTFRLVGTGYKYTGPIWQYKGRSNETIVGMWSDGVCDMSFTAAEDLQLSENILNRRNNLYDGIKAVLKAIPVSVGVDKSTVIVSFQDLLICGINVEDESYKIYNVTADWANQTSYLCEEAKDGTWYYYLDTLDECIGESQRLVMFEAKKAYVTSTENEITEEFKNRFVKPKEISAGAVYEIYEAAAVKLWKLYSHKYDLRPRSLKNSQLGKNRGIEFWKDGKHLLGISVGKTTTIYVHDDIIRGQIHLDYNQDTAGQYRYTFDNIDACLEAIKGIV